MKRYGVITLTALAGLAGLAVAPILAHTDPREVIREVAERADKGDAPALYQLALLHEQGYDSIPQDTVRAMHLLRLSAEGGDLKAQNYLGYKLLQRGDATGLNWLEKAAIAGDAKAQGNIGYLLLNSDLVEHDPQKAAYWLERAATGGVATASSMLGDLYRDGNGVAQDSLQAEAHYEAAIDAGLTDAAYKLVDLRGKEWENLPDSIRYSKALYLYTHRTPELALPIFRSIAGIDEQNPQRQSTALMAKSLAMLGDAYTRGLGVVYSHEKSLEYYLAAAIEGDPSAAFVISELLEIFPDALNDYLPEDATPESTSPSYWREKAEAGGINSAEEAHQRLFTP